MRVYAVLHGEKHEGGMLVSIHASQCDAIRAALEVETCFEGGWKPIEDEDLVWENGCEFVEVVERELE